MIASPELPWQHGVFILVIYQWKETKGSFDSKNLSWEKWRCSLDLPMKIEDRLEARFVSEKRKEMELNWYYVLFEKELLPFFMIEKH